MVDEQFERDVHNLSAALDRLGGALAEPESGHRCCENTADAFNHVMDTFWIVARKALEIRGIQARLPRLAVQAAHDNGWIENPAQWMEMLKDEYELSGSRDPITTRRIYPRIRGYHPELCRTHELITAEMQNG